MLAQMEGQEYFTGAEPHFQMEYGLASTLMGAETVQSVLVQEAAKHIVERVGREEVIYWLCVKSAHLARPEGGFLPMKFPMMLSELGSG